MNKNFYLFLIAFSAIMVVELSQFTILPNSSEDGNHYHTSNAFVAMKNELQASDFGQSIGLEVAALYSDGANSKSPVSTLDPVTILLLGSALIGLLGLGRRKRLS